MTLKKQIVLSIIIGLAITALVFGGIYTLNKLQECNPSSSSIPCALPVMEQSFDYLALGKILGIGWLIFSAASYVVIKIIELIRRK